MTGPRVHNCSARRDVLDYLDEVQPKAAKRRGDPQMAGKTKQYAIGYSDAVRDLRTHLLTLLGEEVGVPEGAVT